MVRIHTQNLSHALDTLNNDGLGAPVKPVGLIVSAFRPSDDATTLQYLFLSQKIVYQNGKPVYLVDLTKAFEWLFNIKIGDCYQKHEDVIKRKPGKLTEFLNGLADLIRKEHDKKGYR